MNFEDASKYEEGIWKLPGLQRQQFYAAAYYLSVAQRQQRVSTNSTSVYDADSSKADPSGIKDLFLDVLALLFARFKNKRRTARNVTAAALVIDGNKWDVWLAKNAGPYRTKGFISDEEF